MSTQIRFGLPEQDRVSLKIYDVLGWEVAVLLEDVEKLSGWYTITWDGKDKSGRNVSSGIYIYHLITNKQVLTQKLLVIK